VIDDVPAILAALRAPCGTLRWCSRYPRSLTYLASGSVPGGVHDGDTLSASAIADRITLYVNGVEVAHASDTTFPTGNHGMGFWRGGPYGSRGDYGFTSYSAMPVGP